MSGSLYPDLPQLLLTNNEKVQHHANNNKKSNVRVICRIKPLSQSEFPIQMKIDKENSQVSILQHRQETTKTFTFNRIYTDQTQQQFVAEVCQPILERAFSHHEGSLVFSYGVTNSGKTHTILGSQNEPGILPYLVKKLSEKMTICLSAIELYNDQFFSLTNREKLTPREAGGFLDFEKCESLEPINETNMTQKFKQYITNRTQNDTKLNSKSSRSHAIFRIKADKLTIGVIDLAGSERTNNIQANIDETSNINKSLLCLGRCIKALNQGSQLNNLIPYRQSKLTKVLIEYFAAKVGVLMIANINQSHKCFHQNMKVLDYAVMAKDIKHCSSQNSLRKKQFKIFTNKVDIFDALYKSGTKSPHPQKNLKSSRSKINESLAKSAKLTGAKRKHQFATALKAQQLKNYIEKFDNSQEVFDYLIDYAQNKEMESDLHCIEMVKASKYHSPNRNLISIANKKQFNSIGVGSDPSYDQMIQQLKKQMRQKMKEELKKITEEQRQEKMVSQETWIGKSLLKCLQKQEDSCLTEENNLPKFTPQKEKNTESGLEPQMSFVAKTSKSIYSSVKKIISENYMSIKNIMPSFKKSKQKRSKFSIFNLNDQFEQIFKFNMEKDNIYSMGHEWEKSKPVLMHSETQTDEQFQKNQQTQKIQTYESYKNKSFIDNQQTFVQTDYEKSQNDLEISHTAELHINKNKVSMIFSDTDLASVSQESQHPPDIYNKTKENKNQHNKFRSRKQIKENESKDRAREAAQRVASKRKLAAQICRQKSRTPLKNRLRSRKNQ